MAFIRYKGEYAYLVANERRREGKTSRIRQRVLYYLGREPRLDDDVVAAVTRRFPAVAVDWDELRRKLGPPAPAAGAKAPAKRRAARKPAAPAAKRRRDDWSDWR